LKLKVQILTLFILTGIAVVVITGYLYYSRVKGVLLEQNVNELRAVSKAKAARVNALINNKIIELEIIKRSSNIKTELYKYIGSNYDYVNKISLYNNIIRSKEAIEGINRIMILDSQKNLIISSTPSRTLKSSFSDYESVNTAFKTNKTGIEYRYNEHEELVLCFSALIDSNYVLVIENDVNPIISVTEDYTGLGSTGETSIFYIDAEGNLVYLTPLRFYNKAFLKEVESEDLKKFKASLNAGIMVFSEMSDYRKSKVVASVNNIDKTNWKIMTKMDVSETLVNMDKIRKTTVVGSVFIIIGVSILVYIFAYFFVKPINEMAKAADEISNGNLSMRVEVNSKNELGQLAVSFNKMTDSLLVTQKDLQNKLNELNRSNEALDKFAHVVSHDIKAPLNSIEGLASLLKMELSGKLTPETMDVLVKLHDQARKTKGMIRGILEYAELKSSKGETEQVDLNEVVENIRSVLMIPSHIKLFINERLPIIAIERVLVGQIFQNLISNAVKYIDKQEGIIRIGYKLEGDFHAFTIVDNGKGIEKEYQSKIFDIFNTGEVSKDYESTGVGLSIVKNIITEKGGSIKVESTKGEGTTFYFSIPIKS